MLANPTVGDSYRQEYYKGHAEDVAEVVKVGETTKIDIGEYTAVVVTKDWNPLDPENGVRHVKVPDPDGNAIAFAELRRRGRNRAHVLRSAPSGCASFRLPSVVNPLC